MALEDACPPPPSPSPEPPEKKGRLRLLILLPAVLLVAVILAAAANWRTIQVMVDPLWALKSGAERVMELPRPLSLGFLGEVAAGETAVNCSGVLELQADRSGLTLALRDCTAGTDEDSVTFSAYVSPRELVFQFPELMGKPETWYGLDLTRPVRETWPLDGEGKLQAAVDQLRETLSGVTSLEGEPAVTRAAEDFLRQAQGSGARTPGGYTLSFFEDRAERIQTLCQALGLPEERLVGPVTAQFDLTKEGVLQRVWVDSWNLDITLELGEDPAAELTPRLEATWLDGKGAAWSVTLALTVDRAPALTPPDYQSVLRLLPGGTLK